MPFHHSWFHFMRQDIHGRVYFTPQLILLLELLLQSVQLFGKRLACDESCWGFEERLGGLMSQRGGGGHLLNGWGRSKLPGHMNNMTTMTTNTKEISTTIKSIDSTLIDSLFGQYNFREYCLWYFLFIGAQLFSNPHYKIPCGLLLAESILVGPINKFRCTMLLWFKVLNRFHIFTVIRGHWAWVKFVLPFLREELWNKNQTKYLHFK